jgi:hypothetical protein
MTKHNAPRKTPRAFTWSIRTEKLPPHAGTAAAGFALEGCDGCGCGDASAAALPLRKRAARKAR